MIDTKPRHYIKFRTDRVSDQDGVMYEVSLIAVGEAKGHEILIDQRSLETALDVLEGMGKLPAFLTHNGALVSDRLLQQIGFFSSFYIEDDKLKAGRFTALDSFRKTQPNEYAKLFDIANTIPETFGISLVFEAELAWKDKDDKETYSEDKPKDSAYDQPFVRFVSIQSADFVDTPAANEEGLFQTYKNIKMEDPKKLEETEVEEEEDAVEDTEEVEASAQEDSASEGELGAFLAIVSELKEEVNSIADKVAQLSQTVTEHSAFFDAKASAQFQALKARTKPIAPSVEEPKPQKTVAEMFMSASFEETRKMLKENRGELAKQLKTR